MSTLGDMKARGVNITLYCQPNEGPGCYHATTPSIDQLIQYFGVDFDISANRDMFLGRFVCQKCGRRFATVRMGQGADTIGINSAAGSHDHGPLVTIEEATRRYHEMEAERRRLGIKSNAELNAESRAKLQAAKKAERSGESFIGPPNPWAHRKRRRYFDSRS